MDTEILRPVKCSNTVNSFSSDLVSTPQVYDPVSLANLVNEVAADDGSTYITVPGNTLPAMALLFGSENFYNHYLEVSKIICTFRAKADPTTTSVVVAMGRLASSNSVECESDTYIETTPNSTEWETFIVTYNGDVVIPYVTSSINNGQSQCPLVLGFQAKAVGSKGTASLDITQAYVEVIYDDGTTETTETIYLKENGSWTSVPCMIYKKQNGAWVESDATVFENGNRYIFQEIT